MHLHELPKLKRLLDLMGVDNGSSVNVKAELPTAFEAQACAAERELWPLSDDQMTMLAMGEETERQAVVAIAPHADAILQAAFDGGPLAGVVFEPWRNIHDARQADARVYGRGGR